MLLASPPSVLMAIRCSPTLATKFPRAVRYLGPLFDPADAQIAQARVMRTSAGPPIEEPIYSRGAVILRWFAGPLGAARGLTIHPVGVA